MKKLFSIILFAAIYLQAGAQQLINTRVDILEGTPQYFFNEVVYLPAGYNATQKYPLVVFLHGMGEAGSDVNRMYNTGLPKVLKDGYTPSFPFIMVAPQHNSYSLDPRYLNQVINEAIRIYPNVDTSRIYLTGLSAGGWSAYGSQLNISTALGKRIAGLVILSGATQDANKNNMNWWGTTKTPLWAVVGNNDLSYRNQNQDMVNSINAQVPGLASITIRAGYGHGGWNDVYNGSVLTTEGQNMWQWLYQFSRVNGEIVRNAGSTPPPPAAPAPNQAPQVTTGGNPAITLPQNSVTLTSTATDADGTIAAYNWSMVSGPSQAVISNANTATATASSLTSGVYTFKVTVTDNDGATASAQVNVNVAEAPQPVITGRTVKVNIFDGSTPYNNSEWNNWSTYTNTSAPLKFTDGSNAGITASMSSQSGVSNNGTTLVGPIAPAQVLQFASYSTGNRTLTIRGLDNSKTYSLEFFAARMGATNNTTRFTINGSNRDVLTDNNSSIKAVFNAITPVNGTITIQISKLNTYNYLNGFSISEG